MVVLDGHNMMGTGPNQYLQPDYLSPLPTTLDAKKSPLALLAQTCSQIGADSPNTKSLLPSLDSKRKSSTSSDSSNSLNLSNNSDSHHNSSGPSKGQGQDRDRDSVSRPRSGNSSGTPGFSSSSKSTSGTGKSSPAFKPYESYSSASINLTSKREDLTARKSPLEVLPEKPKTPSKRAASNSPNSDLSPSSGSSSAKQPRKSPPSGGDKKSSSSGSSDDGKSSPKGPTSNCNDDHSSASPIIRSGLEVLQGHGLGGTKDFKANSSALSSLSALAAHYPPGFDPTNPAMRPQFFGPPSHHPLLGGGYPPSALGSNGMPPYLSYTRIKTPSGAETIVPVCKDPFCTGCSLSMPGLMANAAAMAAAAGFPGFLSAPPGSGGVCPAGCVQCDHQKFSIGLPPFMAPPPGLGLSGPPTSTSGYPSSLLSQHAQAAAAAAQQQQHSQRPFVCNWIMGDGYCGKRYPSSDELFQHLRTHPNTGGTSEASSLTSAMSSPASLYSNALLSSSMSAAAAAAAAMHRTYPTPPLSPLSAARYNPYAAASLAAAAGKPGGAGGFGVPTSLSSLVPHPQSLANYYSNLSPYAMYGQRIGPPVHP